MVMFMSPLDAPGRGWDHWRFAALIPSGCRLTPIHKDMGVNASRGSTPPGASPLRGLCRWLSPCSLCPHQGAYRTRIDRPIRNVVFGVMPFRAQRLLTVVWYLTAIEPSVSPDLIL